MNNNFEKLAAKARDIRLTDKEKHEVRNQLISFMERNPVRVRGGIRLQWWRLRNPFYSFTHKPMPVIALIIALVMGVGTSYAAEAALPGDALYPVKVHVNENVRSWVAVSNEAQADWDAQRAQRRLEEAERLAAQGELNAEVSADVESRFASFADRVNDRVEKLRAEGNVDAAVEVSSRFESALRAHEEILERFKERGEEKVRGQVDSLIDDLKLRVEVVGNARQSLESRFDESHRSENNRSDDNRGRGNDSANTEVRVSGEARAEASAQAALNTAVRKLDDAKAYVAAHRARLNAEAAARVDASLADAQKLIDEGKLKLQAQAYAEAFIKFNAAHRAAEQTKSFLHSLIELALDVPLGLSVRSESEVRARGEVESDVRREDRSQDDRDHDDRDDDRREDNENRGRNDEQRPDEHRGNDEGRGLLEALPL